ncbi:MAG TPA: HEAT repeat domain-containing protein [Pyrinomonadaceae bacterium]|jgi:HEAT repeat protein|nr:HEAT repeat domain-containing protein [Pyrinomonadaceae bacterium]
MTRIVFIAALLTTALVCVSGQTKTFTPVEGANLKSKIDNAIIQGRNNAPGGRFWVAYQFEVRPGVATDFEVVDGSGGVYISMDGTSMMFDARYETRELGLFLLFDVAREQFTRMEVYNLKRNHEFSGYPVFWAGRIGNEESLNYLKAVIDSAAPEVNRLAERATFAIALHDDARVDPLLMELIRRPISEPIRSRAIYWLGNTPESAAKNTLFTEIIRNTQEGAEARHNAMSALAMSRSAATLPLLQNLFETMTSREMRRRALTGIGRNDNSDAAATYLIHVAETEKEFDLRKSAISALGKVAGQKSLGALTSTIDNDTEVELQRQAVVAIGRRPKDESVPILIRVARNHPKMPVRKQAIQVLGQTGDERAIALFRELLSK